MAKVRVGVLFGGRSGEHEVSLASAYAVMRAMDPERFEVVPIGIDKQGRWLVGGDAWARLRGQATVAIGPGDGVPCTALGTAPEPAESSGTELVSTAQVARPVEWIQQLDIVFPVLHGTYGEDGTIQGLFEMAGVPYVGAGVTGSALCMDKILAKRVLASAGIPQADFVEVLAADWRATPERVRAQVAELGYPCFVKPANLGSSVGIAKVHGPDELAAALDDAARYDRRLIVEQGLEDVMEIEISVLGNDQPIASVAGEIVPCHEFYDYQAKYLEDGSVAHIPARLPPAVTEQVQTLAVRAYLLLDVAGMARIDFFVTRGDHRVYLNELNTLPGFTPISMYPKLWQASGLEFSDLIERLIELGLRRHRERAELATSI